MYLRDMRHEEKGKTFYQHGMTLQPFRDGLLDVCPRPRAALDALTPCICVVSATAGGKSGFGVLKLDVDCWSGVTPHRVYGSG